jgi:hypothetical protein
MEQWLKHWETTYSDCKALDLPDVSKDRPQYDFVLAVQGTSPTWSSTQEYHLNKAARDDVALTGIHDLFEDYRQRLNIYGFNNQLATRAILEPMHYSRASIKTTRRIRTTVPSLLAQARSLLNASVVTKAMI